MHLSENQLSKYKDRGFLFLPDHLPATLVDDLQSALPEAIAMEHPGKVYEQDDATVRMIHGIHQTLPAFEALSHHPRIIEPVKQMLGSEVYIHQFKVNFKAAFEGEVWQWHQDYVYLHEDDGVPTPRMANAIVFLDEVNEFNGPLLLIPGSHKEGNLSTLAEEQQHRTYAGAPSWMTAMTTRLKYTVSRDVVARLAAQNAIVAPKGPPGSVLFFHPDIVHGSSSNMSPTGRSIVVINFNSTENLPVVPENPRPDFLASRDYSPIIPRD